MSNDNLIPENVPSIEPVSVNSAEPNLQIEPETTIEQPDNEHEWLLSDTKLWYYYEQAGLRRYQSGSLYREKTKDKPGVLLEGPKDTQFTTENAQQMVAKGREVRAQRAIEGMAEAISEGEGITVDATQVPHYWGKAVMQVAMTPGRAQAAALRLAAEGPLELIGKQQQDSVPAGQVRLSLTADVQTLRQALAGKYSDGADKASYRKHEDVIEGEVKDASVD